MARKDNMKSSYTAGPPNQGKRKNKTYTGGGQKAVADKNVKPSAVRKAAANATKKPSGTVVKPTNAKTIASTFGKAQGKGSSTVDAGTAKRTQARAKALGIELKGPVTVGQARKIRAKRYLQKTGLSK